RYGVEKTLDASIFFRLAMKQRFINQVIRGEASGRTFEDFDSEIVASFSEAAAEFTGDPLSRERVGLETQVRKLQALRRQHEVAVQEARHKADTIEKSTLPEMRRTRDNMLELHKQQ